MKLIRGKKYRHITGSNKENICIYSHSTNPAFDHFFTVTKNKQKWKLDELNQTSLPTWDIERNMKET